TGPYPVIENLAITRPRRPGFAREAGPALDLPPCPNLHGGRLPPLFPHKNFPAALRATWIYFRAVGEQLEGQVVTSPFRGVRQPASTLQRLPVQPGPEVLVALHPDILAGDVLLEDKRAGADHLGEPGHRGVRLVPGLKLVILFDVFPDVLGKEPSDVVRVPVAHIVEVHRDGV